MSDGERQEPQIVKPVPEKFCIGCAWYGGRDSGLGTEVCVRPVVDLVTGATIKLNLPCRDERRWNVFAPQFCGRDGAYYVGA